MVLYVFNMYLSTRNIIFEVPNWHLEMIFNAVANCDRLDCAFDIAICEVIHLTQNKKPIPFENRLKFDPKIFVEYPTPRRVGYTLLKIKK
jgi:hypothetical protein